MAGMSNFKLLHSVCSCWQTPLLITGASSEIQHVTIDLPQQKGSPVTLTIRSQHLLAGV